MAARWIELGWATKLPLASMPNAGNLRPDLVNPSWDPTGEYTLPWANVATVIGYNRKLVGGDLTSINDLFDPRLKGKVTLLTELRDTLGLMLLAEGRSPAAFAMADADPVFERLQQAKSDGQIRAFTGNDYLQDLSAGNIAACFAYSGDIFQIAKENPDIVLLFPDEGALLEADVMLIPSSASNAAGAGAFMDFFYDPVNAAKVTAETGYISPVSGVAEELRKLGGEAAALADSSAVNPSAELLAKLTAFRPLTEDEEASLDERFSKIIGV
jgi:spermidine/putrescine transport system substrate-binding protein